MRCIPLVSWHSSAIEMIIHFSFSIRMLAGLYVNDILSILIFLFLSFLDFFSQFKKKKKLSQVDLLGETPTRAAQSRENNSKSSVNVWPRTARLFSLVRVSIVVAFLFTSLAIHFFSFDVRDFECARQTPRRGEIALLYNTTYFREIYLSFLSFFFPSFCALLFLYLHLYILLSSHMYIYMRNAAAFLSESRRFLSITHAATNLTCFFHFFLLPTGQTRKIKRENKKIDIFWKNIK